MACYVFYARLRAVDGNNHHRRNRRKVGSNRTRMATRTVTLGIWYRNRRMGRRLRRLVCHREVCRMDRAKRRAGVTRARLPEVGLAARLARR